MTNIKKDAKKWRDYIFCPVKRARIQEHADAKVQEGTMSRA